MRVAILTIGNELMSGRTQDTNTALIARSLHIRNWTVTASVSVGDDEEKIREALSFAMADSDAVIVTGGLGPTADDITTAAIARAPVASGARALRSNSPRPTSPYDAPLRWHSAH